MSLLPPGVLFSSASPDFCKQRLRGFNSVYIYNKQIITWRGSACFWDKRQIGTSRPTPKSEPISSALRIFICLSNHQRLQRRGKWEMLFYNESLRQRHTETCLKKNLSSYILLVILQWEKHTKEVCSLKRSRQLCNVSDGTCIALWYRVKLISCRLVFREIV